MNLLAWFANTARQTWTSTRFAFKRLLTQRLLSLAAVLGLIIASGFIFSVPLYADAIYFRLFREELFAGREDLLKSSPVDYAPLPFVFELQAVGRGSPQWEDVGKVDTYLSKDALQRIGLPAMEFVRRFHTDFLYLYPPGPPKTEGSNLFVDTVRLAFISPAERTVEIVRGAAPKASSLLNGGSIEAMVSETMALAAGVQVGSIPTT